MKKTLTLIGHHPLDKNATTYITHLISRLALLRIAARTWPLQLIAPSYTQNERRYTGCSTEDSKLKDKK